MVERGAAFAQGRAALCAAACAGALEALAFAPYGLWPIGIACIAALWWLWQRQSPRQAARTGFAFGAALFAVGTYWLYTAVHGFGKAPVALALLLMAGLVAMMATYYALVGYAFARLRTHRPFVDLLCLLPATWVVMEWLRGWFLTGFPWLAIGYAQIDTPLAGYAQLAGVYGVGLAAAVVAGSLAALASGRPRAIAVPVAVYAAGFLLGRIEYTHESGTPVTVAIVQGAISQDEKWQEENRGPTLKLYRSLTESALGSRIVLWPEATLPQLYHEVIPYLSELYYAARARGSDLVLGLLRYDAKEDAIYNGLVALGDGEQWYYKRHLVPFGEYFPVPAFVRSWLRLRNLAYVDLRPGDELQAPLAAGGLRLGETICYEDAYAAQQLRVLGEADALVNVSNDAWYGDSSAPHQHLEITRMRALEAGRWMMRATNNGISAIIGPDGRIVARGPQFRPYVLKGSVTPRLGLTPYARFGNLPVLLLAAIAVAFAVVIRRRTRPRAA